MKKVELKKLILDFINDESGEWDWDDFISIKQNDPEIEEIRQFCLNLPENYPSPNPNEYCNEDGVIELKKIAEKLTNNH